MPLADATRSVALLGPTNTGKTHRAVERMLEHPSGMIGLPLRLLAREIYDRVSEKVGQDRVALVTGEEKRVPRRPDYWVCTTEAMPLTIEVDFLAVDEIQLAAHDERGHVFTDRLLHARGRSESWFLGSHTMQPMMERLVPAARQEQHPRLSRLSFTGKSTIQRLQPRSAIIAFSISELYQVAARLRALRGGTAVVLGALSPRTRNAQVGMFQAGEVDYLVATDAIGMGLNLDISHVAFASVRKFDGRNARSLDGAELAQIAGRAGRYLRDGTFGTVSPLELATDVAALVEQHRFEPVRKVRYRNSDLDFSSPEALIESLEANPRAPYLVKHTHALDVRALKALLKDAAIASAARSREGLDLLWSVCQIPDYRQILFEVHVELLRDLFTQLLTGPLSNDFLKARAAELEAPHGDVDTLVARLSHLRTWAFVVNRAGWVASPELWREELGALEADLSDALHAGLVGNFVERRVRAPRAARGAPREVPGRADSVTSVDRAHPFAKLAALRERLREQAPEAAPLSELAELVDAPHSAFALDDEGHLFAGETRLGALVRGSSVTLPDVRLVLSDELPAGVRLRLHRRLLAFARDAVSRALGPITELGASERAPLRAVAYQLARGLGSARTSELRASLDALDASDLCALERAGVTLGVLVVFRRSLLGRQALRRRALLVSLHDGLAVPRQLGQPHYAAGTLPEASWLALGYLVLGGRAFRVDLVERAVGALGEGKREDEALRYLSVSRRDRPRVLSALRRELDDVLGRGSRHRSAV